MKRIQLICDRVCAVVVGCSTTQCNALLIGRRFLLIVVLLSGCGAQPTIDPSSTSGTPNLSPRTVSELGEKTTEESVATVTRDPQVAWPGLFGPDGNARVERPGALLPLPWKERWRFDCGSGYSSAVAGYDRVYVQGRIADLEYLWALDQDSGAIAWERQWPTDFVCEFDYSSGPASTPLIAFGRLYAIGAQGRLTAHDPANGQTIWERDLSSEYGATIGAWGFGSSPIAIPGDADQGDSIVVLVGGAELEATLVSFSASDGTEQWRVGSEPGSYSTPRYFQHAGENYLSVLTEESLLLVNAETHQITAKLPYRSKVSLQVNATTPVWHHERLIVSAYGLGSAAYQVGQQGELIELWNDRRGLDSQYNVLIPDGGELMGFSSRIRELRRMSLDDGSETWGWYSSVGRGNAIQVGEELVLLGEGGDLIVLKADASGCQPVSEPMSIQVTGRCFTTPAFVDDLIVVRAEGAVIAYEAAR